ncbi:SMC family ATPase (plasmid) [Paraburkholderia acidicola]|uniref:SMC family ATPase n=1 Tax=Paraburkholderia acidicola TaxID=1912599 RepID=A0ABV1LYC8_9BURK
MTPLILELAGFIGVRDGMKRERVSLDLQSLPKGLVALTGPNGAGKSTLMDNLHPYRIMPSQASKLSVDAFSYWDHVYGAHAMKTLEWEHAGARYRSSFVFRKPGRTGKAEYFMALRAASGAWQPVTLPDGTVSDGKAETYDRCVESVCGSAETFFTSVFAAQNRRPLASYNASEIKGLLAELLKIDHLRALSAKAADVAKILGRKLDTVQQQIVAFGSKREQMRQVALLIDADTQVEALARSERQGSQVKGETLAQQRATLFARQAESAAVEARLRELGVRRNELKISFDALATESGAATQRENQRRAAITKALAAHEAVLSKRVEIEGATARRDDAQMRMGRAEALQATLHVEIRQLEAEQLKLTALTSGLAGLQSQGSTKATLIETLIRQASVIDAVPCVGHGMHAACPLLEQARLAAGAAGVERGALNTLRDDYRLKKQEADRLAPVVAQLGPKREELRLVIEALAAARREFEAATELAARRPLVEAAMQGVTTAREELAVLEAEAVLSRERRDIETKRLAGQLAAVEAEASKLAQTDVTAALAGLDREITENREAVAALDARIEALIRTKASRETQREALSAEVAAASTTEANASRLSDEIACWKLLAKGLGNDGVIALTIDDAGPALTKTVNDLLLACYGMGFTVEIRTQRELASGDLREGFEILVHDAEHDSTKAVGVMSGGQRVWINECLTRGIALYLANHVGQPYRTLFSDEADGPLDPERKRQFMRMKREVLKQGGYEREFFISQTPELVAEADAVIDVAALAN